MSSDVIATHPPTLLFREAQKAQNGKVIAEAPPPLRARSGSAAGPRGG